MRGLIVAAALALGACAQPAPDAQSADACTVREARTIDWPNADAPVEVSALAHGPTCEHAVATLTIRDDAGAPLWVHAATYYDLSVGGVAPESPEPVAQPELAQFLASWTDVTLMNASQLPQWSAEAASLSESADTFTYATAYDRDSYEAMREQNLPLLCYAAAAEATHCLAIEPVTRAPALIVAYGP